MIPKPCASPECSEPLPRAGKKSQRTYCDLHLSMIRSQCGRTNGVGNKRLKPTDQIDQLIREAYTLHYEKKDVRAVIRYAAKIGWRVGAVRARARELRLTRPRDRRPWTEEENSALERWGHLTIHGIYENFRSIGLNRTVGAIEQRATRMRIKSESGHYSAASLGLALGVTGSKVARWIGLGLIKSERRGTARVHMGDDHIIAHEAVRKFVIANPEEVDLHRVSKLWFLELLCGDKICKAA